MCQSCGFCGASCEDCWFRTQTGCKGCRETNAAPFGKPCFVAEYVRIGGESAFAAFEETLIGEINALGIEGVPTVTALNPLPGSYVNLTYLLPNGENVRFLDDDRIYLATQLECGEETCGRCFGIVADTTFFLIASYGENGSDPELIAYVKR